MFHKKISSHTNFASRLLVKVANALKKKMAQCTGYKTLYVHVFAQKKFLLINIFQDVLTIEIA